MPGQHAILSPSGASRWILCPPSVRASEGMPDTESEAAKEGTLAHAIAELKLRRANKEVTKRKFETELAALKKSELYADEMEEYTDSYVSRILELFAEAKAKTPDAFLEIEKRLDFSGWIPGSFGTGDAIIVADQTLTICDLKYGKGVEVQAEDNPQIMIYALGAYEAYSDFYDIRNIHMEINQPRLGGISYKEMDVLELLDWANLTLLPAAKLAWEGKGDYNPGEHQCRFCKLKTTCKARADYMLELQKYNQANPNSLSLDDISEILTKVDDLVRWAKEVQDFALESTLNGDQIPGWKAVEGRSVRKIIDEEQASLKLLGEGFKEEEIYNTKLKGITDLEKKVGKKELASLLDGILIKPKGKPTLAPETDKRPPLSTIDDEFDFI